MRLGGGDMTRLAADALCDGGAVGRSPRAVFAVKPARGGASIPSDAVKLVPIANRPNWAVFLFGWGLSALSSTGSVEPQCKPSRSGQSSAHSVHTLHCKTAPALENRNYPSWGRRTCARGSRWVPQANNEGRGGEVLQQNAPLVGGAAGLQSRSRNYPTACAEGVGAGFWIKTGASASAICSGCYQIWSA